MIEILYAYLSMIVLGLADSIRGPLFPDLIRFYHWDNSQASLFFSLANIMSLPGGYLAGKLLQHWGHRWTLQASLLLMSGTLFGFFLAPSSIFVLGLVASFGLAMGLMSVTQNVLVIETVPPGSVQKWQFGLHTLYGFASLLAPLLVLLMMHKTGLWQTPFLVVAVLTFLLALILAVRGWPKPKPILPHEGTAATSETGHYWYAIMVACYVALEILMSTRIAQFARTVGGWGIDETNYLNTAFFVGMFVARLLFFLWQPRLRLKFQMSLSLCIGLVLCLLGIWVHPVFLAIGGIAVAPFYPLSMTLAGQIFPKSVGQIASHMIALTGISLVMMQSLVGFLADRFGLSIGMMAGPFFGLIALALLQKVHLNE